MTSCFNNEAEREILYFLGKRALCPLLNTLLLRLLLPGTSRPSWIFPSAWQSVLQALPKVPVPGGGSAPLFGAYCVLHPLSVALH